MRAGLQMGAIGRRRGVDVRSLSRGGQRVARLGKAASLLGAVAAALFLAMGVMFACLVDEPIYHRIGSAMILGVMPGLVAYAGGRLLDGCLTAASLIYDPICRALARTRDRAASGAIRLACQIGRRA